LATIGSGAGQMLMRGTEKHTRQEIQDIFDGLKATVSVFGSATGVGATILTDRDNLKATLDLVAEILKSPSFPGDEFEQLRQQQLTGLESQRSQPQSMASLAIQRHLNPYPRGDVLYVATLDELIEETKQIRLDQIRAFHGDFYGASDGEITFVGDFDAEAIRQQTIELFGSWPSPREHERVKTLYHDIEAKNEAIEAPDKPNAMWVAGLTLPMNDFDPDYPAMTLANYILGSGMNSRLFTRIRQKEGLSYAVGSQFMAPIEDKSSVFMAYAICAPQNAPKVEAAFGEELQKAIEKGFSAEEVDAAKKSWLQSQQVWFARDQNVTGLMTTNRRWDRTMLLTTTFRNNVMALTPDQLQQALAKHIDPARLSIFRAGDFEKAEVSW